MKSIKENQVTTHSPAVQSSQDPTLSQPTSAQTRIHWAGAASPNMAELEQKFEAMRARNWITDRMVEQYQKHWHCSREQALERLLAKAGA